MIENRHNAKHLLQKTRVRVAPETFSLISLRHDDWLRLLENPELSPRMTAPFMIFKDEFETTLMLDEIDFGTIRYAIRDAKTEGSIRRDSGEIQMQFSVIGFLAEV